jgi:dipeptidyl aminopeptidase/acylaminoacyl peptidase
MFLGSGAALAAWAHAATALDKGSPLGLVQRPFSWRDVDNRSNVQGLAISTYDSRLALQVTRPLRAGGTYVGAAWMTLLDLRGDVWLLDSELGHARRMNAGERGVWSPSFSPDGRRLSALTLVNPGQVGLVVWELATDKYRIFSDTNVELFYSKFRTARTAYGGPSGFFQIPLKYLWLDETSILFVDHGPAPQQSLLAPSSLPSTLQALHQRTVSGQVSVRVWDDHSPTCGAGSRLVKLACDTGEIETVYRGDVRGVSVSPDGRQLAVLVAAGNIRPASDKPMQAPLRATTPGDDTMVALKFTLVELMRPNRAHDIEGVASVGNVAPSRLPTWSAASLSVAVPVRTTYSDAPSTGDDAVWEVKIGSGEAYKWSASSALDAELVAALITTEGLNAKSVVGRRPETSRPQDYTVGGQISGGAWRCAPHQVMFWSAPVLRLISPFDTVTMPTRFASVQPPAADEAGFRTLAARTDGKTSIITTGNGNFRIQDIPTGREWSLLGIRARDGAVIYNEDADTGTYLILAKPGERARRSALSFNTYFRHVLAPQRRIIECTFSDGNVRRGLLQLPVGHRSGERHPVIVWAYPNSTPTVDGPFTRANSDLNTFYPIQYLLTRGFAFLQVPFPIAGRRSFEPMRAAADAVLPWLGILDRQAEIVPGGYGFFGHSNAGYVALALETLTHQFKAIVAWCTFPEIGYDTLHSDSGNVALNCAGNLIQSHREVYEDPRQPYAPQPAPPWKNPGEYIRNEPLFKLNHATTPLLLVEGELDSDPREVESVYSILYGRGVPVELAYYWGEGHLFASPGNIRDCWLRTEGFFKRYL